MGMVIFSKSWKEDVVARAKSFLEPLKDLLLSWMAYLLLATFLTWFIGDIIWMIYAHGWNNDDMIAFYAQRSNIRNSIFQLLYISRVILRWRKHFPCILRWLSPWSAEQHTTCPLCSHTKPAELTCAEGQQDYKNSGRQGVGIFL